MQGVYVLMSRRTKRAHLKVSSRVWVELNPDKPKHAALLQDMALCDANKTCLRGVRMHGTIRCRSKATFGIYLDSAQEEFSFPVSAAHLLNIAEHTPRHYVVVDDKIDIVKGLLFSELNKPDYYHLNERDATRELRDASSAAAQPPVTPTPVNGNVAVTNAAVSNSGANADKEKDAASSNVRCVHKTHLESDLLLPLPSFLLLGLVYKKSGSHKYLNMISDGSQSTVGSRDRCSKSRFCENFIFN